MQSLLPVRQAKETASQPGAGVQVSVVELPSWVEAAGKRHPLVGGRALNSRPPGSWRA